MADFGLDSAVSGADGRHGATLSEAWEIWGPQGGYVAAVALRAAGLEAAFPRPASLACQFLRPAQVGPAEVRVESLRGTRRAEALRATVLQEGEPILTALVWTVALLEGLDHSAADPPAAPPPEELEPWDAYLPGGEPPFPYWRNLDVRPVVPPPSEWGGPAEPRWLTWKRLRTRPPLEDPFVDAGRMLMVADSAMYPAATQAHAEPFPYVAPSLDLVISFHDQGSDSEWLLVDGFSPLSQGALVAGAASIWSADGRLLASAAQQMLQRT
ncbi:MAG: thioesterase family protein [Thermoleophilia bacterium]|nr:thioesterase family protein [Thermoleophilia bacterium]